MNDGWGSTMATVLVLDDEKSIRSTLGAFLRGDGYEVIEASEAEAAIDWVDRQPLDVALLDLFLGKGNGLDVARHIRHRQPDVKTILMTGEPNFTSASQAIRLGVFDYVVKPFDRQAVLEVVGRAAAAKAREQEYASLLRQRDRVQDHLERQVEERTATLSAEIEEHKRVQQALELAHDALGRRNAELQDFYHTVSHELKTPLTSAREFVAILLDGIAGPLTDDQRQYLQLVRESCDQLQFCVGDLLEATRLDTGKLEVHAVETSVETLVANVVDAIAPAMAAKGIELRREIDPALVSVPLDERRINQVCMNLLGNALKFTPAGGVVTVRVGNDPDRPEFIRFSVSDTGRGIAAEHLDRIFDKLYQVREADTSIVGGVGLGLYIASGFVRLHGGRLWVESEVGRGSTFHFTVPKRARPRVRHILCVDDDESARRVLRTSLEQAGFEVIVAQDGETALELVQGQTVDLAIVDLCLPGMSGPALIRELRSRRDDLPLVLYTGYPESGLMAQSAGASSVTLLLKTGPMAELVATVRSLLDAVSASPVRPPEPGCDGVSRAGGDP